MGDVVVDGTRLYLENMSAESGGGTLHLSGSVNYAESPVRYDISVRTDRVRIRYPEGMSWLFGGSLRLTGTPTAGLRFRPALHLRGPLAAVTQTTQISVIAKARNSKPTTRA